MRINIPALKTSLDRGARFWEGKASDAQAWVTRLSSFDFYSYGLKSKAYKALNKELYEQSQFAAAQKAFFEALANGDRKNRTAAGKLEPSEPDGSVDTDKLRKAIQAADTEERSWGERLTAISKIDAKDPLLPLVREQGIRLCHTMIKSLDQRAAELERKIRLVEEYTRKSASFYQEAQALRTIMNSVKTSEVQMVSGSPVDMTWLSHFEREARKVEITFASHYLKGAELKAYQKAMKDGKITKEELYSHGSGKANTDLWRALSILPSYIVSDETVETAMKTLTDMSEDGPKGISALEKAISASYAPTGQMTVNMPGHSKYPYGNGLDLRIKGYGFKASSFMKRMRDKAGNYLADNPLSNSLEDPKTAIRWGDIAMVKGLLDSAIAAPVTREIEKGLKAIWSEDVNGPQVHVNVIKYAPVDGISKDHHVATTARLLVFRIDSPHVTHIIPFGPPDYSVYTTNVTITGNPQDVANMLSLLQKDVAVDGETGSDYVILTAAAQAAIVKGLQRMEGALFSSIPIVGFSTAADVFKAILQQMGEKEQERIERSLSLYEKRMDHDNPLFKDGSSVQLKYSDVNPFTYRNDKPQGYRDYSSPDSSTFIFSHEHEKSLEKAYDAWLAAARSKGQLPSLTKNKLLKDLHILVNPSSPGINDDEISAFIAWCQQNAHLTYKHDTTDPDGTHHHKGDTVKNDTFSNYDFIQKRFAKAHSVEDYQFDFEAQPEGH